MVPYVAHLRRKQRPGELSGPFSFFPIPAKRRGLHPNQNLLKQALLALVHLRRRNHALPPLL